MLITVATNPVFGGLSFDDVDDIVTGSAPITAVPFTVCVLVRSAVDTDSTNAIFSMSDTATSKNQWSLEFRAGDADNPIQFNCRDGGSMVVAEATAEYTLDIWHTACGVAASATSRTAYIDGGNSATNTTSCVPTSVDGLAIGARGDSSTSNYFEGDIAIVDLWDVALTAQQVLDWHNAKMTNMSAQIAAANCIDSWQLHEVGDRIAADGATFRSDGTTGTTVTASDGANNTGMTGLAQQVFSYP